MGIRNRERELVIMPRVGTRDEWKLISWVLKFFSMLSFVTVRK